MSEGALGPSGGTAASIAGAFGVSLSLMVTTLPTKRARPSSDSDTLRIVAARLRVALDRLAHLAERDAQAYAEVIEARRRPNNTHPERLARQTAIQRPASGDRRAARHDARV
jgi:formiminotetrahydrofolate cyclodeaminase